MNAPNHIDGEGPARLAGRLGWNRDRPAIAPRPRVLVYVGVDKVGDGLMKLPFIRALRAAYPAASLIWFAGRGPSVFRSLLGPMVDGLLDHVVDTDTDAPRDGWRDHAVLREAPLDVLIDTQRSVRTAWALRQVRPKLFVSGAARFLLSDARPRGPVVKPPGMLAQLLLLLDAIEAASGRHAMSAHPSPVPMRHQAGVSEATLVRDPAMRELAARLLPPGPTYVAIAPGAGGTHKAWPIANFLATARAQSAAGRIPVWLLGPDEADLHAPLAAALPGAKFPLQTPRAAALGNRPDLTIALAMRCAAGLANDSGAGHMLAAAQIPLLRLFGPTDPAKFAQQTATSRVLRAQHWGGSAMSAIPVDAVIGCLRTMAADRLAQAS